MSRTARTARPWKGPWWALALALTLAAPACLAGPKLACEQPEHRFGRLFEKDSLDHAFVIRNAGDAPLVIRRIEESCGCTTNRMERDAIPPGRTARLFTTADLSGRAGEQDIVILVFSNDPDNPRFALTMTGEVRRGVEVRPQDVFIRQVLGDPPARKAVEILSGDGRPFRVTGVDTGKVPFAEVGLPASREGTNHVLTVSLSGGTLARKGTWDGTVAVRTDHPKYTQLLVRVTANVDDELVATPSELEIARPPDGSEDRPPRFLMVRSLKRNPIEILDVSKPLEGVETDIRKRSPDQWALRVRGLPATSDADGKQIRIRVKTSSGEERTLVVPIRISKATGAAPAPR